MRSRRFGGNRETDKGRRRVDQVDSDKVYEKIKRDFVISAIGLP